jgi:ParB family chromosome partitioning protein
MLGEDTAPCIVISANECEAAVLTVIENIQRENLNFFEEAQRIEMLIARLGLTQSSVAEKLGLSQSCVANKLRLLKLSSTEKKIILENSLTERHARALLRISDEQIRKKAAIHIAKNKMNVAASEKYIDKLLSGNKKGETKFVFRDLRIFVNTINMAIETMRRAGVDAEAKKGENEAFIEYIIKIPKQVTQK